MIEKLAQDIFFKKYKENMTMLQFMVKSFLVNFTGNLE